MSGHCKTSHLISKNEKFFLRSKLDDSLNVLPGEDLTSWVAGVDDDDGLDVTLILGGIVGSLQFSYVQRPVSALIQIITNLKTGKLRMWNI